jgi:outer membrane protein assembly factor BamB
VLNLSSDPQGARVTLRGAGGSEIAVPAPTPTLVDVRAGTYRARFELDGFEPQEKTVEVFSAGAKTACAMRWETGDLVLEGFQKGIQVEIHRGERIGEGTLERSVTLPLDAPIRLPSGRYALRATSEDHFARDLEGPSSASVPSGGSTRLDLWLRPVEQRLLANLKSEVHAFAFSDVDEDGLPEILVRTLRGTLTALAHDGSRRFEWSVPDSANCLATADVDGDGAEEILAATRARIVGFGPDGSRRWESAPLGGIAAMAVAQLDGRGPREVVAVTADWRIVGLALDGATLFDEPSGLEVYWLTAADLDGDGRDEVYTANEVPGEIVARRPDGSELWRKDAGASAFVGASFEMGPGGRRAVLAGNWEGRVFALDAEGEVLLDRTVQGGAYALAVIDLESDGTPEILAGTTDGRITAFTGEGARLFETQVRGGARALGSADCDGDGRPEILVGTMAGEVHSLDFQPDLAFEAEVGDQVQDLSVADLEGEGRLEVVVGTTGSVACFESSGRRRFRAVGEKSQYASPRVVDLDGDGRSEVVLGLRSGGIAEVGPDGRSREFARMDSPVYVLQAVDLDGDGRREIFAGTEDGQVVAFGRDGAPRFRHRLRGFVWSVEGGDLDGDSRPEIAAGSEGGDFVLLDASGAVRTTAAGPAPVWVITFADVDMDGTREILAGWRSGLVRVFRADGTTRTEFHAGALFALAPVDLDGDRTLEFVAGGGTSVRAFRLDGTPLWSVEALGRVWALRGADLDADGVPEVVAGTWGGEILVLDAAGRRWEAWRRAGENRGLEVADLEGDGTVEIVVGEGHRIAVYGPSGPDRRRELRRIFFEAIEALDREEEAAAAEGFERARFRWLAFDPSGVEGARARLALHRNSPSARKMSAILERVRPGTALGAVEGIGQLVDRGLYDAATASAKDLRSRLQEDPALAEALNALAWKLVDPASPHPPARTVALELARAAVSANPERSAFSLDTLAEALHANGRSREAVEVETEALSRCPPENASLRQAIEASLARFRAAAEGRGER